MESEYDFSNAEQGKFHHADATLNIPVYLESEVRSYLSSKAKSKGIELNQFVNELLRKDIDLAESIK